MGFLILPINVNVENAKEIIPAHTKNHILRESVTFSPSRQPIQWILMQNLGSVPPFFFSLFV